MYFKQPRYYSEFSCIGSDCSANCCYGWRIDWTRDEIDKVINAPNCSQELKEIMEKGFAKIEKDAQSKPDENESIGLDNEKESDQKGKDKYIVIFDKNGKCPCVTEDGLCRIQRELGAEYLSKTCTIYPRYDAFINPPNTLYRGMYLSCQEVVRKLINDEKAAELVNIPIKSEYIINYKFAVTDKDIEEHPELKYRIQIVEFYYELIGDKKCSLETNLILGALAAEKLTELVEKKDYDRIPEALKVFRKQVHNAAALKSIDNIKPNYNISIGVVDRIIENSLGLKVAEILKNKDGVLDIDRYVLGKLLLKELMKDKSFWLRNIALTLILELFVPFRMKDRTIFENYRFYVASVACIKLNAIAAAISPKKFNINFLGQTFHFENIDNIICGLTGIMSRRIFQSSVTYDRAAKIMDEFGMNSPAYLALLLK